MSLDVAESYDAVVELYASINLDALERDANARRWLEAFIERASSCNGPVADLGCGPGHVVHHLRHKGLSVVGYDISHGQIAKARETFPDSEFHVGDLKWLDAAESSLGGIVSRYSIIHLDPSRIKGVFEEWWRVLEPGAPMLVSFFGSTSPESHGLAFDHKVTTAYELFPATIAWLMGDVGFAAVEVGIEPPPADSARSFDQATILGRRPLL